MNTLRAAVTLASNQYFRNAFGRLTRNVAFCPLITRVRTSFTKSGQVFTTVNFDDGTAVTVCKCENDAHDEEKAVLYAIAKRVYGKIVVDRCGDKVKLEIKAERVGAKIGQLASNAEIKDHQADRVAKPAKKTVKVRIIDGGEEPEVEDSRTCACRDCGRGKRGKGKQLTAEGRKLRQKLGLPTDKPFSQWTVDQKRLYWRSVKAK